MARTTVSQVQGILGAHWNGTTDLTSYIELATVFVDNVAACALSKGVVLTSTHLELIERWMAAHYYLRMDPTYKSRSTASASGSWNTDAKDYFNQALGIDISGCVNALQNRFTANLEWLGKPPSEQLPYHSRD